MKQTRILMGMPITVEIVGDNIGNGVFDRVYDYFDYVDKKFSTYKKQSEISRYNDKRIDFNDLSDDVKAVLELCDLTKRQTDGYFEIEKNGRIDPSGLVKGWSIYNAFLLIENLGFKNFYIDAGGDVQVSGRNGNGKNWILGIQNPFNLNEIVKTISVYDKGVATSGTYIRGQHVYDPKSKSDIEEIVGITVIGPNIYEADRFATAAFAMGTKGIDFVESLDGFEGYMIDRNKRATFTSRFDDYVIGLRVQSTSYEEAS